MMETPPTAIVEYPCGCRYSVPPHVKTIPRTCPEHWLMDKAIRLPDEPSAEEIDKRKDEA